MFGRPIPELEKESRHGHLNWVDEFAAFQRVELKNKLFYQNLCGIIVVNLEFVWMNLEVC